MLTLPGTIHTLGASIAIGVGAFQLLRPKRDQLHRRLGYVYVTALGLADICILFVYEFTHRFNIFHALAIYSLVCLALALRPMLVTPRPHQWKRVHYMWIAWSYGGLMAAGTTEFLLRVVHVPGWWSALLGTPPVIILASVLITRYAPPLRPPAEGAAVA